jgi:hypothetical protein
MKQQHSPAQEQDEAATPTDLLAQEPAETADNETTTTAMVNN